MEQKEVMRVLKETEDAEFLRRVRTLVYQRLRNCGKKDKTAKRSKISINDFV